MIMRTLTHKFLLASSQGNRDPVCISVSQVKKSRRSQKPGLYHQNQDDDFPSEEISEDALEAMTRAAKEATSQPSPTSETETPSDSETREKPKGNSVGEEFVKSLVSIAEEFVNSVTKFLQCLQKQ